MALPFHAPADLPLPPGAWDALQVLLADDTGESQVRWAYHVLRHVYGLDLESDEVDFDINHWDLVPSLRPVSSQDFVPLTRARRHRDEEEEEEPISKRPRFSYDEYEEPTLSDSAGTFEGFIRYFLQPHLPQDSDSEQD